MYCENILQILGETGFFVFFSLEVEIATFSYSYNLFGTIFKNAIFSSE